MTDVESEADGDVSATTDVESWTDLLMTESLVAESLEFSTIGSLAAESLEDFATTPRQLEHFGPMPSEVAAQPTSPMMLAPAPPEAMVGVGSSLGPSPEGEVPTVLRLRSEAGQQKQRERQKQRRLQHRQPRK